ncbi:MAG: MBL fold metallo-hydrolase [Acidobacteria bacterium]|nr:MBL fold metallo-hydrolase [Acidobacteriota bacterium]MYD72251.1 MBL fold metallo-hydrolase [Acidobacteriota bacterium]MYJ04098.1 MBL fold metallo-hydrolase [Acidobacteriota bacterium]
MRRPRLVAAVAVGGLAVLAVVAAERPAAQQEITPERLAELTAIRPVPGKNGLYVIPGLDGGVTGGNVAVRVTNDGVVLVDNKFPYSYEMITTEVRKMTSLPIRYVLDTHHHGDHSGSNADFMAVSEVISHKNARGNMIRNNQPGAPRVVFSDETSIFIGGVEVQAHHFGRGHTDGDAVIYFPDLRTIHTGDLFIWGQRSDGSTLSPFMDFGNGGSGLAWTGTLDGVLELDFDTVIPGHGPILGKDEVRIFRDRMQTLQDRMREAVEAGVSRDDVPGRIQTDDLDWPLSDVALQRFYDEVSESQ